MELSDARKAYSHHQPPIHQKYPVRSLVNCKRLRCLLIRATTLLVVASLLAGCNPTSTPRPTSVARLELDLTVQAQLSGDSPEARLPLDGMPFTLHFEIKALPKPGDTCGNAINLLSPDNIPLKELRYSLLDETGAAYFSDKVTLYGYKGPGTLILTSGLTVPDFARSFRVQAELDYDALTFDPPCLPAITAATATTSLKVTVSPTTATSRYERIRTAYLSRHLLEIGRNLSWIWLKEYDPQRDRKELLDHSRTFRAPGDTITRVYVPWTFNCADTPPWRLPDGSWMPGCGRTVDLTAESVYGGNENPLLRGGIAMAAFALEARQHLTNMSLRSAEREQLAWQSLRPAIQLLDYVEASEWIDAQGRRTGFFLRTRWPGNIDKDTQREYFSASADEIVGMVLGLVQLHRTLTLTSDIGTRQRIEALAGRLATRLAENRYMIVPYRRVTTSIPIKIAGRTMWTSETPTWEPIGLVNAEAKPERQKGWSATFVYEWFLNRAFKEITGHTYEPPRGDMIFIRPYTDEINLPLPEVVAIYAEQVRKYFHLPTSLPVTVIITTVGQEALLEFLSSVVSLNAVVNKTLLASEIDLYMEALKAAPEIAGDSDEVMPGKSLDLLVRGGYSPHDRAIYTIQSLGILTYYDSKGPRVCTKNANQTCTQNADCPGEGNKCQSRYPVCQRLIDWGYFFSPGQCLEAAGVIHDIAALFKKDIDPSYITAGVPLDSNHFNNTYMLHAFYLANPVTDASDADVTAVRLEMARYLRGLLAPGGATTQVALDRLVPEEQYLVLDLPDLVPEYVGNYDRDPDYYAAALARAFNLSQDLAPGDRQALEGGIEWAITSVENDYARSAPLASPSSCVNSPTQPCSSDVDCSNGPCQTWPAISPSSEPAPIGQAFCWEKEPGDRTQDAGRMGLQLEEISRLYELGAADRGDRYAAVKEGAGLDYLLPYLLLKKPLNTFDRPWEEFLPVCFTLPALSAKSQITRAGKCNFSFKTYQPDPYDQKLCRGGSSHDLPCSSDFDCGDGGTCADQRNDSLTTATKLTMGPHPGLTIDKASDTPYWSKYAYFKPAKGGIFYIQLEADYDFYYIDNPEHKDVRVVLEYNLSLLGRAKRVYLDGFEGAHDIPGVCPSSTPCPRTVTATASGRDRHTMMVTGDIGPYEINIEWVGDQ